MRTNKRTCLIHISYTIWGRLWWSLAIVKKKSTLLAFFWCIYLCTLNIHIAARQSHLYILPRNLKRVIHVTWQQHQTWKECTELPQPRILLTSNVFSCFLQLVWFIKDNIFQSLLTLTLPGPSAGVSGSLDSYCSLKPLCSGMGEVVPARTSLTLLPPSPRTVLSLSCFKVSQCINCRD